MRSQDILWGMANDLPTFSFSQEIIAVLLNVEVGNLTVSVGSFHVYVPRMEMFREIMDNHTHEVLSDMPPRIVKAEALQLINCTINPTYEFSKWLLNT
jgi:thymidylate synthase